jgi:succinyl-diaminopimelate desuccinylase
MAPDSTPKAPSHLSPMFNLDVIRAGSKSNIVPGECTLIVNRRYIPEERFEDVVAEVEAAVARGRAKSNALDVKLDVMHIYPAYRQSVDHPLALQVMKALQLAHGYRTDEFVATGMGGSTDMADVARVLNTDKIAMLGPGRRAESRAHGNDESVRLSDLTAHAAELVYLFTTPA